MAILIYIDATRTQLHTQNSLHTQALAAAKQAMDEEERQLVARQAEEQRELHEQEQEENAERSHKLQSHKQRLRRVMAPFRCACAQVPMPQYLGDSNPSHVS